MIEIDKVQQLTPHLNFEFDPAVCQFYQSSPHARYPGAVISEVDDLRYVRFVEERFTRPSYQPDPVDGIVQEYLDDPSPMAPNRPRHDQTLHGLVAEQRGHIALYSPDRFFESIHQFELINGPGGANNVHKVLGRTPGIDIPKFESSNASHDLGGVFTAGQITEAIADMKILAPSVSSYNIARHDLSSEGAGHGTSWPNALPVVYRNLSQTAQNAVEQYGDRIHLRATDDITNRPPVVVAIAKALDLLVSYLNPSMDALATMENNIRNGLYDKLSDIDIARGLLAQSIKQSRDWQTHRATHFLAVSPDAPESERYRRGYWLGLQMDTGVIEARQALHEVRPHPEATDAQTLRALNVLNILKVELDRRLNEKKDHLLVA